MGKRSRGKFKRADRDFYVTPPEPVAPLIPHLAGIRTFAEPCAGDGAMVRHLEAHGLRCIYAGDIATGQDALAVTDFGRCDAIITNPPWSRPVLHRLIPHFQAIAPTWLLFDQDWACTKQAVPYLPSCSDIIAIGRVKWIAGTKNGGFDNASWFRFEARHAAGPVFHPYRSAALRSPPSRLCGQCGKPYRATRSDARWCSSACRQAAYRKRNSSVTSPPAEPYDPIEDFVRARELGFAVIRQRMAGGGPGWNPDAPGRTDRPVDIPQNLRRPPR